MYRKMLKNIASAERRVGDKWHMFVEDGRGLTKAEGITRKSNALGGGGGREREEWGGELI